jgi:hypothetical protein
MVTGSTRIANSDDPVSGTAFLLDEGIDLAYPDLARNIWKNPKRGARDRHGRDFVDDTDPFNPRPKVFLPPFDDTDRSRQPAAEPDPGLKPGTHQLSPSASAGLDSRACSSTFSTCGEVFAVRQPAQ